MKSVQMVIDVFAVELDDLSTYAKRIKAFLSEEFNILDQEIERALEGLSHDKKDDLFHEKYSESFHQLDRSFPSILIKSLFISTYSTLEVCLDRLCNVIHKTNGFHIEPKDLAGDGIFRSKAYLIKVARIDFPEGLNPWQKILHMNKLRNHYVHNGSNYVGLNSPVHKAAKAFKSISIEDTFRIEEKEVGITITYEFCIDSIELMKEFLKDLRSKL